MNERTHAIIDRIDTAIDSHLPQSPEAVRRRRNRLIIPTACVALGASIAGFTASNVEHEVGATTIVVDHHPLGNIAAVESAVTALDIEPDKVSEIGYAGKAASDAANEAGHVNVTVYENFWGKRADVSTPPEEK